MIHFYSTFIPKQRSQQLIYFVSLFLLLFPTLNYSQTTVSFTTNGSYTWTAPACVNSINVQVWGAGGAGGGQPNSFIAPPQAGGGGGGGAYLGGNSIPVVAGTTYTIVVGRGGTGDANDGEDGQASTATFGGTTLTANGGKGGKTGSNGAGGAGGTASPGGFAGGTGAVGLNSGIILAEGFGGGGGGGGGTSANGANGQASAVPGAGGTGNTNGSGGRGGDPTFLNALFQTSGAPGESYGGGGGGANSALIAVSGLVGVAHGGNGADGAVIITFTNGTTASMDSQNSATICTGEAVNITLLATPASTFTWLASDNLVTTGESTATQITAQISDAIANTSSVSQIVTYTVTPTAIVGGCLGTPQTVSVTVNPKPVLSSTLTPTDICSGTSFTYAATSATPGATFAWSRATVAGITETGTSNTGNINEVLTNSTQSPIKVTYTFTTTANTCVGDAESVEVNVNTGARVTLTSGAGTDLPNVCENAPLTDITYTITGATGATVTGLPSGTTGVYSGGLFTISGTPSAVGVYDYVITATGVCSQSTATGRIRVGISLTSVVGTDSQNVCISVPITNVTYAIAGTGAIATGLPTGVNGNFASNIFTISGTPSVAGTWHYTVTATGPCPSDYTTGVITVGLGLITQGTDTQSVCKSSPIADIQYTIVGGDSPAPTVNGLPTGVSANVTAPGILTISGTPTTEGLYNYTVTTNGTCGTQSSLGGSISVGMQLMSAAGTDTQSVCKNTPIINIVYGFGGGDIPPPTIVGLPAGVTGSITGPGVFTISGSPSVEGVFNYTLSTNGSCATQSSLGGRITVGIGLSAGDNDTQSVCKNEPIVNIVYTVFGGDSPAPTVTGLPPGVSANVTAAGEFTISGTPIQEGRYVYTVTTNGTCTAQSSLTGMLTVGIGLIVPGTDDQSICKNTPIVDIDYAIVGGDVPPPTVVGLPAGVSGSITAPGVFTISGIPSEEGLFTYTVTTNGTCATQSSLSGNLAVGMKLTSVAGTDTQKVCKNSPIINIGYAFAGGNAIPPTVVGLPNGVSGNITSPGELTISGTPTIEGIFDYTVTTNGTCASQSSLGGRITVGIGILTTATDTQSVCKNSPIADIQYAIVGGDIPAPTVVGLPAGVSGSITSSGVFTISGTPTQEGLFNYTVTTQGTCSTQSTLSGSITIGLGLLTAGTDTQSVCKNTPIVDIEYAVVGGDAPPPAVLGLPLGVSGSITAPGIFTISGTPTQEGLFTYTVVTNGTCASQSSLGGSITVGMKLTSAIGTDAQKICKNVPITTITYAFGGGANPAPIITGLPAGVSGSVTNIGEYTISGTPVAEGYYSYTLTTQGTCATSSSLSGTITVGLGLLTKGVDTQSVCKGEPISTIAYAVVGGDNPAPMVTGLPTGVTGLISAAGVFTISGVPTVEGQYTFTVVTRGTCGTQSSQKGMITVGIGLKTPGTNVQALCKGSAIQDIVYSFVGGNVPPPSVIGLPAGVSGSITAAGEFTISGTPTAEGIYNYIITTGGTCSSQSSLTGTLTVDYSVITISSATGTDNQKVCANTPITNITYAVGGTATGVTVSPLPKGLTSNYVSGTLTIGGSPDTVSGTYTFTISPSGACATSGSKVFTVTIVSPRASFTNVIDSGIPPFSVDFVNTSTDANTYTWLFGDGFTDTTFNATHMYDKLGILNVQLIASFNSQCPDTASTKITVYKFVMPNIFTPNGDNNNDLLLINNTGLVSVDVEIYNRWGLKMAEWHSLGGSWDGHNSATGGACPEGVYYYIVNAKDIDGGTYFEKGIVNLIR